VALVVKKWVGYEKTKVTLWRFGDSGGSSHADFAGVGGTMSTTIITKKDWITFAQLTMQTGIPEQTLRRYAKVFGEFVASETTDHLIRFEPRAAQVFLEASAAYARGLRTEAVRGVLAESHGGRIVEERAESAPQPDLDADLDTLARAAVAHTVREVLDLRADMAGLKRAKEEVESRLADLEAMVEKMAAATGPERKSWWRRIVE